MGYDPSATQISLSESVEVMQFFGNSALTSPIILITKYNSF